MRKIVFHLNNLELGGVQRVVTTLAGFFADNGDQVFLATEWVAPQEFVINEKIKRVHVGLTKKQESKGKLKKAFYRIKNLRDFIKKEKPDIVIAFSTKNNYRAILATIFTKIPVIISIRNNPFEYYNNWKDKMMIFLLLPKAEGTVFQTEGAKCFFSAKIQKKSRVILNPINPKYLNRPAPKKRRKAVVHSGRLEDVKNQLMLIEAFIQVHQKHPDYKLEIYGGDSGDGTKELLEESIKKHGAGDYVVLMGSSDKLEEQLIDGAAYAFSSKFEGLPNALMEAMALGLPVVATDCPCGGPKTLIEHEVNGLLVPTNDSKAMAEGLLRLLEDKEFAEGLGTQARKLGEIANTKVICEQWRAYIDELCEK